MHLFAVNVRQGTRYTVVGDSSFGVAGAALSPNGQRVAFSRTAYDNGTRPWLHAEVWVADVATRASKKLLSLDREAFNAPGTFAWSPDSKALAFCASAKEVLEGEDSTFSVYENNLYAVNVDRPSLVNLSDGFIPNVGGGLGCSQIVWNSADGKIYVPVDAGARTVPARTKRAVTSAVERTTLEVMHIPNEVMSAADIAGTSLVAATEGPTTPPSLYRIDLATGASTAIAQPNAGALTAVDMPAWKAWNFKNSRGEEVEAWYWTPPGFDSTKTYPMVVHYYGGTLPMKKNFENRLLWFASNGYVVLFMNPAGTPGYGQKFANYHINDWGFPAATDIIEGTEQFTKTHRFVDSGEGRKLRPLVWRVHDDAPAHADEDLPHRDSAGRDQQHRGLLGRRKLGLLLHGGHLSGMLSVEPKGPVRRSVAAVPGRQDHCADAADPRHGRHERGADGIRAAVHGAAHARA